MGYFLLHQVRVSNTAWTKVVLSCYKADKLTAVLSFVTLLSVALLVLVPACFNSQYLMEPSPEPRRNCLTGIIIEKHKMAFRRFRQH